MTRAAFTLLEVMAVLVIVGLFAAAVTLTPSDWFAATRFEDVAAQVRFMDQLARQHARRADRAVELAFDLRAGRIDRRDVGAGYGDAGDHHVNLPRGYTITRIVIGRAGDRRRRATVPVDRFGHSPSYAMRIVGPGERARWIVFAGLTGQMIAADREQEIDDVFDHLAG